VIEQTGALIVIEQTGALIVIQSIECGKYDSEGVGKYDSCRESWHLIK